MNLELRRGVAVLQEPEHSSRSRGDEIDGVPAGMVAVEKDTRLLMGSSLQHDPKDCCGRGEPPLLIPLLAKIPFHRLSQSSDVHPPIEAGERSEHHAEQPLQRLPAIEPSLDLVDALHGNSFSLR